MGFAPAPFVRVPVDTLDNRRVIPEQQFEVPGHLPDDETTLGGDLPGVNPIINSVNPSPDTMPPAATKEKVPPRTKSPPALLEGLDAVNKRASGRYGIASNLTCGRPP